MKTKNVFILFFLILLILNGCCFKSAQSVIIEGQKRFENTKNGRHETTKSSRSSHQMHKSTIKSLEKERGPGNDDTQEPPPGMH